MKGRIVLGMMALLMSTAACNKVASESETENETTTTSVNTGFTDLETGKPVELMKDPETGYTLDAASAEPVEFYVNMNTMDTFYGRTGTVVNNAILVNETGYYELDEDKIRWDDDTMTVINTSPGIGTTVVDTGKESDETKVKVDEDELKIKHGDQKIKVEDGKTKVKRK
ncbi:MAG: hypothetical protein K0R82_247 [Flavipsychrobacter sp.]|nr:hypothetical protein [Flavipsychrobacter sp.]